MSARETVFENYRWEFDLGVPEAVRQYLAEGRWPAQAEVLKTNRRRTIYRVSAAWGLIVKHDRAPGWLDRLKSLWRNAGQREYAATSFAQGRGLPAPRPVGHARRGAQSLFAVEEVLGCQKLSQAWASACNDPLRRRLLLQGLEGFARRFGAARVRHPDMHAGNILVREGDAAAECFLVDLAGLRPRNPKGRSAAWDRAGWVTQLAPAITRSEAGALLAAAGVVVPGSDGVAVWQSLLRRQGREAAARWPGRRRRLLRPSSLCEVAAAPEGTWRLFRPFPLAQAQEALRQHLENTARGTLLKNDRKRRLSRVVVDGKPLVVKEFLAPGRGPWRADRRSWMNHYRLAPDVWPVCRCHAWLEGRGRGVLILADVGPSNLQDACRTAAPAERRRLLAAAARLLAGLHALGTVPRDMKATNLVVSPGPAPWPPLYLVDADAVRFDVRVRPADRARNLRQLGENLPGLAARELLRAAVEYRREAGIGREGLRRLLADAPRRPA